MRRLSTELNGGVIAPSRRSRVAASFTAMALTASVLGGTAVLTAAPESAQAAPGNPGTPSAPTVLYSEGFQNTGATPELLTDYTSTSGETYTAANDWLTHCNGIILQYNSPDSALSNAPVSGCTNPTNPDPQSNAEYAYSALRQEAWALGQLRGNDPATNNVVSAYTQEYENDQLSPNEVEFQTVQPIALPQANGRYVTFSVDGAAVNCNVSGPLYNFYLVQSDGTEVKVGDTINMCDSGTTITAPAVGNAGPQPIHVGTYTSNGAIKLSGSTVGVILRNGNGSGNGNDASFDNIQILDATPQMDKSFSPTLQRTGDSSTLTFTVTNTSDLGSKQGWGFTDNLPNGLTLANSTVGGTCDADTSAPAGGSSITVTNGNLAVGERSCTITVQVTSTQAGTYQNCPVTNVTPNGLNEPACATVRFADPSFTVDKTVDKQVAHHGDKVTYTLAVKNTGEVPYTDDAPAKLTDDLSKVLDDATYNNDATSGATVNGNTLTWSGALAVGETKTITYSVTVNNAKTGDDVLDNKVTPQNGGSCATAESCTTTTPVQSFTYTKTSNHVVTTPGGILKYTVTVTNTGQAPYTTERPASFNDNMTGVLDDATYNGDASDGATLNGETLSWSGPLAVGESREITYSVTVNNPVAGDKKLVNAVTTDLPDGSCDPTDSCTTITTVGSYTVTKSVDKEHAAEGDKVTYAVAVTNTGTAAYTDASPATFEDDMTDVLDDATYNNDATNGATFAGNTLSWSGPLAVGQTVTVTYSVTVTTPDTGDRNLHNVVIPGDPNGCSTADSCETNTPVDPPATPPRLALTGTEVAPGIIGLAALLLALGGGLMVVQRRRQNSGEIDNT